MWPVEIYRSWLVAVLKWDTRSYRSEKRFTTNGTWLESYVRWAIQRQGQWNDWLLATKVESVHEGQLIDWLIDWYLTPNLTIVRGVNYKEGIKKIITGTSTGLLSISHKHPSKRMAY